MTTEACAGWVMATEDRLHLPVQLEAQGAEPDGEAALNQKPGSHPEAATALAYGKGKL